MHYTNNSYSLHEQSLILLINVKVCMNGSLFRFHVIVLYGRDLDETLL